MKNRHCTPKTVFDGRVKCVAGYGIDMPFNKLVAVYVETFPGTEQSLSASQLNFQYADHDRATATEENLEGGKIFRYHGPKYNPSYWYSGDQHIEVFFYYPIPQMKDFVSYYIKRFPSTLQ